MGFARRGRLVSATIRAWDVDELTRSAQYAPPIDYVKFGVFTDEERQKAEGKASSDLAKRGFVAVPSVATHGGVVARGAIQRDVTVNLVALRQLDGEHGEGLRRYVLGLALLAATELQDGFLRQGCLLTANPDAPAQWNSVARSGTRTALQIDPAVLKAYAEKAAEVFGVGKDKRVKFDPKLASADLSEGDAKRGKRGQQKSAVQSAPAT